MLHKNDMKLPFFHPKVVLGVVTSFWGYFVLIRDVFFCLNYMLALLAVFVTTMTFDLLGDLNGGSAVMLILPLIVAAMMPPTLNDVPCAACGDTAASPTVSGIADQTSTAPIL